MKQCTLIALTSQWGSQYGGINAFNTDFLEGMSETYGSQVNIVCVVDRADEQDVITATEKGITLVVARNTLNDTSVLDMFAKTILETLASHQIQPNLEYTVWLGHDRISGAAALAASKHCGGRSALIHHMSYASYESYAEDSQTAKQKEDEQKELFLQADIRLAIGPLLRNALIDLIDKENVSMLIPGLADISPKEVAPRNFSMFVSGRLSQDAVKIKQGYLAIAALSEAQRKAQADGNPEILTNMPKLVMRGVELESLAQSEQDFY